MHWESSFRLARRAALEKSDHRTRKAVEACFASADPVAHETRCAVGPATLTTALPRRLRMALRRGFQDGPKVLWSVARASLAPGSVFALYRNGTQVATGKDRDALIRQYDPDATIEE